MKDFVKKVLGGSEITPPDICLDAFGQHFDGAVNTDWFKSQDCFEAVFYMEDMEHIAIFNGVGELEEYRKYLPFEFLPQAIRDYLEERGELMNIVLINKGDSITYEAIIRDKKLERYLILLTDLGKVLEDRML